MSPVTGKTHRCTKADLKRFKRIPGHGKPPAGGYCSHTHWRTPGAKPRDYTPDCTGIFIRQS